MDGDREKCLASGMSDYMSKPVLAKTLATTLEKWILPDGAPGANTSEPILAAASEDGEIAALADPQMAAAADASSVAADTVKPAPEALGDAVDATALATLRSMDTGDEDFMAKIIELFLIDLTERLVTLKSAAETRDGPGMKSVAHALKGSCGHFGAVRLASLCRKMEQLAIQDPVGDPAELFLQLRDEADRVRVALEAEGKSSAKNSATNSMEESD
jgi:HPt (histidine-containing phosphotransfer) domain-containing protein